MKKTWIKWLVVFLSTFVALIGLVFAFQLKVDPFGVWGTQKISGFNNYKTSQEKTERLFKIYQYEMAKPDVVLFGSSRLNYCTPAKWPGVEDHKVYNFGINAAHIPEEKYFVDYAIKTYKPKIVAIGIDLLQFSSVYNGLKKGFDKNRLKAVAFSAFSTFLYKSKETVLSYDAIKRSFDVMSASKKNPDIVYHEHGWDTRRLKTFKPGFRKYRQNLFRYHTRTYSYFKRSNRNYKLFSKMIKSLKKQNIKVVMYIHPVSVDFLVSYDVNKKWSEFEKMKRKLVKLGSVWDFNYINDISTVRSNYSDPSHFKAKIGKRITRVLSANSAKGEENFGILINKENIEETLKWQRKRFDDWLAENTDTKNMMIEAKNTRNRRVFNRKAVKIIGQ